MFELWHLVFRQAEYAALCGHHANEIAFWTAAHRQPGGPPAFSQEEHHGLEAHGLEAHGLEAHGTGKLTHAARRMLCSRWKESEAAGLSGSRVDVCRCLVQSAGNDIVPQRGSSTLPDGAEVSA